MTPRQLAPAAALLLTAACQNPRPTAPATLDSPSGVALQRLCLSTTTLGESTLLVDGETCSGAERVIAAVANRGDRFLHELSVPVRALSTSLVDQDDAIPGVTGVVVPEGPVSVEATSIPGVFLTLSESPPSLSVADTFGGHVTAVGGDGGGALAVELDTPASLFAARSTDTGVVFVVDDALAGSLRVGTLDVSCGSTAPRTRAASCTTSATLSWGATLDGLGPVTNVQLDGSGRIWAALTAGGPVHVGALLPPAVDDLCGGTPCWAALLPLGDPCTDGVDNDGDGLIDGDDPQCIDDGDDEAGLAVTDLSATCDSEPCVRPTALSACTNGIDDDGDGAVDGDDPDCVAADDRSEGAAFDDVTEFTASGIEVASQATDQTAQPRCSNGVDDDGDGAVDWPDDPDCLAPGSDRESPPRPAQPVALVLTDTEDLLVVVDRASGDARVFDTATLTPVAAGVGNDRRPGPGILLSSPFPFAAAAQTARVSGVTSAGDAYERTLRMVHVAGDNSFADTLILDDTYTIAGDDTRWYDAPLRPIDLLSTSATVERLGCSIPFVGSVSAPNPVGCDDPATPSLVRRRGDDVSADASHYSTGDPSEFVDLASRIGVGLGDDTPLAEVEIPDDYAIAGGTWRVEFEGEIAGSNRSDAILSASETAGTGWIRFAADDPCESAPTQVCSSGIVDADRCPDLAAACTRDADVCSAGLDVCALCPSACSTALDVCSLGVLPGDTVLIERGNFAGSGASSACAPLARDSSDRRARELLVCGLDAHGLRVATFAAGCDGAPVALPDPGAIDELPVGCGGEPLEVTVRAGGWLVARDGAVSTSPYRTEGGQCVLRSDADRWVARVALGHAYSSPYGVSFSVDPPASPHALTCEPEGCDPTFGGRTLASRGFSIDVVVNSNFRARSSDNNQLLLGPSTSAIGVVQTSLGGRIVIIDDARSYGAVFDGNSFAAVGALVY
ncbi:MAG: hypothetical protein H6698_04625 [Myxococcales bacterium]|nr:hypothetical protein [Myxococcales bacterium]MCB9519608.1 hypothetical protein [Myxococcales bacterium]MCB9530665.1 hypothetical protein [Myxococcales bacterium]MCB9533586.1 hypothetical protein [Myxococcales bacterium]